MYVQPQVWKPNEEDPPATPYTCLFISGTNRVI